MAPWASTSRVAVIRSGARAIRDALKAREEARARAVREDARRMRRSEEDSGGELELERALYLLID